MQEKFGYDKKSISDRLFHRKWKIAVCILSCVLFFCTVYPLIVPAVTMSVQETSCGYEEHIHAEECMDDEGHIVCGFEEHMHSSECYSDLYADIEDEDMWETSVPLLCGDRNADVVAVAISQLGYRESDRNYIVSDADNASGYTRYGHWYGDVIDQSGERLENGLSPYAYMNWDAMFVSFVLDHAGIYDMGFESDAGKWAGFLAEYGIYADAEDYIPEEGDLIFFTTNSGDGLHVGIVTDVNRGFLNLLGDTVNSVNMIYGNAENEVAEVRVGIGEHDEADSAGMTIYGYGVLTPRAEDTEIEEPESEEAMDEKQVPETDYDGEETVDSETDFYEDELSYPETAENAEGTEKPGPESVNASTEESRTASSDVKTGESKAEEPKTEETKAAVSKENTEEPKAGEPEETIPETGESKAVVSEEKTGESKAEEPETIPKTEKSKAAASEERTGEKETEESKAKEPEPKTGGSKPETGESKVAASEERTGEKETEESKAKEPEPKETVPETEKSKAASDDKIGEEKTGEPNAESNQPDDAASEAVIDESRKAAEKETEYTLTASGNDYTVTMTYGTDAEIPDSAKLYVREIMPVSAEYESYIKGAKEALGIGEKVDVGLKGSFFDIKIMTKNGEYEPNAPVRVDITYKKRITDALTDRVCAVHFAEDGPEQVEAVTGGTLRGIDTVGFEAESFSVYGVVYTVDFTYFGYSYSIYGNEEITLSEIINELGIAVVPEDVAAVSVVLKTQNDVDVEERELYASEKDGEWIIRSDSAFGNVYNLVIETHDGKKYVVEVTDEVYNNLASYITDAVLEIDGKKYGEDDTWVVRPDSEYSLTLTFRERGALQFPEGGNEMVMDLPDGLDIKAGTGGSFDIPAGLAGTVTGNTYWVDEAGKLHIKLGDDPEDIITRSSNAYIIIDIEASFNGEEDSVTFRDGVTRNVEYDNSSDVSISKKGTYNQTTGQMDYIITVRSTGQSENVKVTDMLGSTNLLTIDPDTIIISSSTGEQVELISGTDPETGEVHESTSEGGFVRTVKSMAHNETVTLTYSADVDYSKLGPGGTVTGIDGNNTLQVKTDDVPEKETTDIVHRIQFSDIHKVNASSEDNGDGTVTLNWKINANTGRLGSLVGSNIIDTIDYACKDVMKYVSTDGKVTLNVVGTDAEGNEYSRNVQATLYDSGGQEYWIWTVENIGEPEDTPLSYEITYSTAATKQAGNVTVQNNISNEGGGTGSGTAVVPGTGEQDIVASKKAIKVTEGYIDWTIVINVPDEGFPEGLTVVDDLPHTYGGIEPVSGLRDTLEGEPVIEGLVNDETWKYTTTDAPLPYYNDANYNRKYRQVVTIDFYRDQQMANPGLDAEARTITIKLRTKNDPDWMAYSNRGNNSGDPANKHWNTARINGFEIKDYGIPMSRSIKKKVVDGPADSDNDGLMEYTYAITLANVTEAPVMIEDTFDTDIFSFAGTASPYSNWQYIAAAEQEHQLNGGVEGYAAAYELSDEGSLIITADRLPTKADGSFYEYYQIYYVLEYKDAGVERLLEKQALANGGTYKIGNTAVWEDLPGHCDVEFKVPVLDKVGAFLNTANERAFTFFIDVNPGSYTLNNNLPMELTDTHTGNLSVDYTSIVVYKIPEGTTIATGEALINQVFQDSWIIPKGEVTWNFTDRNGIFTIPDSTHYVIRYNALVLGEGEQDFANEAEMKGFFSTKDGQRTYASGATAGATVCQIKLLKHMDGMTSHGLKGAVFQLFRGTGTYDDQTGEEIKEPMKWGKDWQNEDGSGNIGENITFTTDENGFCLIALNQTVHGAELELGVHYFLKEVESPAGYKIDNSVEYWEFTLTDVPDEVNYGDETRPDENGRKQWIYFYYDDVMKMANTPTEDPIEIRVDKSWFDETGNEISEEKLDSGFVAKVRLLRKTDDGDYVPVKVEYSQEAGDGSGGETGGLPTITELAEGDLSGQVELNQDNSWEHCWKNLPRTVHLDGGTTMRYAYKIEEVEVSGYIVSVSEEETESVKTYSIKNYKTPEDEETDITVKKDWQDYSGFSIDGMAEDLPENVRFYICQVVSTTPFEANPTSGGSKYFIAGDSRLVYPDVTDDDGEISEGGGKYALYQVKRSDSWTTTFDDLPKVKTVDGKTYYYAYYMKELPVEGYTTTYTQEGETRVIVNRRKRSEGEYIDIGLSKKWLTGSDDRPPAGASATFTLHQLKSDAATSESAFTETALTQTVTLPTKGNWSTTIENLIRKDADGYRYRYYITEDSCSPSGYAFSYTDDIGMDAEHAVAEDGVTVEVTNRDEMTNASVTKVWMDQDSNNAEWDSDVESITMNLTRMKGNAQDRAFGISGTVKVVVTGSEVTSITPAPEGVTGTVTPKTAGTLSDGYVVTLDGLEKYYYLGDEAHEYSYFFSEEKVDSYHEPVYKAASGVSVDGGVASGGSIINTPESAYSLPATGGMGTRVFYLLGMSLIMIAVLFCHKAL